MKGYIKRGRVDGTWYLRVELPRETAKRRRQRETFRGKRSEANARLRELLRRAENGSLDTARLTFVELALGAIERKHPCDLQCEQEMHEKHRVGGWLNATKTRVGHRTWWRYRQIVKDHLVPAFGETHVTKLRPVHIEAALASWSTSSKIKRTNKPLSARSVKHLRDTMRAICQWGVRMEVVTRDPVAFVEAPKCEAPEMRTLDADGVAALLKAANGTDLQGPIAVLVGTGLRRGELLGLRWSDIDFAAGRLTVRRSIEVVGRDRREKPPKTQRSARTLALAAFVIEALRRGKATQVERLNVMLRNELEARRCQESGYVFDRADGSPWNPDSFSWAFAELVRRAKLVKIRLHDLRHSHATLALSAGTDLKTISAALGHSTISITANTYVHVIESMQRSHADRIDAMLGDTIANAIGGTSESARSESGPQRAHTLPREIRKARKYGPENLAPAGFELATSGPGRSLAKTKGLTLYGFRRITVPRAPARFRALSTAP